MLFISIKNYYIFFYRSYTTVFVLSLLSLPLSVRSQTLRVHYETL